MIETMQLIVRAFVGINFRIADVNDLISNATGAVIGFIMLLLFVKILKKIIKIDGYIDRHL